MRSFGFLALSLGILAGFAEAKSVCSPTGASETCRTVFEGPPGLPFSEAVRVDGKYLFVSGQIGIDEYGEIVPGGTKSEALRAIVNAGLVLRQANADFTDVVQVNVYLTDMSDYGAFNEIYEKFFVEHKPARAVVQVEALPLGAKVEIAFTAAVTTEGCEPSKITLIDPLEGLPLSSAALVDGKLLFVSGQIGFGNLESDGSNFDEEVTSALDSFRDALDKSGTTVENTLKTTVYINDFENYGSLNSKYTDLFSSWQDRPGRTSMAVSALPLGARMEIEGVAVVNGLVETISPREDRPYSSGKIFDDKLAFLSGSIAYDETESLEDEIEAAFNNMKENMNSAGVELKNAVKVLVLLKNMDDYAAMNTIYKTFFPEDGPLPARVVVQPKDLPLGANIEVDVVAIKGTVVEESV